jgi:para-aminobenzoate synthetase component 2
MALRHRVLPIDGVQFHPESILTAPGKDLLRNFLESAWPRSSGLERRDHEA